MNRSKSREARGTWPDDRPTTCCRQGAKASPETGTIGLEPSPEETIMLKKGPGKVTPELPRNHRCPDCRRYSGHISHGGLVYRFYYDAAGAYHRHVVSCPDAEEPAAAGSELEPRAPIFDGFPYLVTRVVGPMRHVLLLPADRSESDLAALARAQVEANRLDASLVLSEARAIYFSAEDPSRPQPDDPPRGGVYTFDRLRAAVDFELDADFIERARSLRAFVDSLGQPPYFHCGARTSRRPARPGEVEELSGTRPDGVPVGLDECPACGEYRGLSLGSGEAEGWVATVYCLCENHNRCARCGGTLAERRLNGHLFDRAKGEVFHEPGFRGLGHKCALGLGGVQ